MTKNVHEIYIKSFLIMKNSIERKNHNTKSFDIVIKSDLFIFQLYGEIRESWTIEFFYSLRINDSLFNECGLKNAKKLSKEEIEKMLINGTTLSIYDVGETANIILDIIKYYNKRISIFNLFLEENLLLTFDDNLL